MKLKVAFIVLACFALLSASPAQITTEKGKVSDQVNIKLAKMDLLIKLVPLALKKEQYTGLLLAIESARELEKDALKNEDNALAALDQTVSDVDDNAVEKGVYPPREIQDQVAKVLGGLRTQRLLVGAKMINLVLDAVKAKLNDGQIKVMAGSFSDAFVDPKAKAGEVAQDVKVSFYINQVFLDPLAFDLLLEMSKHAS
jgi:hypothetical protein